MRGRPAEMPVLGETAGHCGEVLRFRGDEREGEGGRRCVVAVGW